MEAKLGGLTGDILGAGSELTEIVFLVLMNISDIFLLI
ncbi:MAG: adenosylcobinamide-GDP ribazoletransferase [Catenibacillus sp.]|nr:adenosylcobinamide-GDP ribazoletransferase [Catenibacillus sp.]